MQWRTVVGGILVTAALAIGAHAQTAAPAQETTTPPATRPAARGRGMPLGPADQPAPGTLNPRLHAQYVEMAKKGDIDLYFLGDSITDWFANPRGNQPGIGKAVWDKEFGGWKPGDFGIAGERTQHVLWRLANGELDGVKPKAFVIMIGTNNMATNTPEEIASGIKAILNVIQEKQPQAKILLLGIFPRNATKMDPTRQKVDKTNEIIAKFDDGKQVKFMNINDKFLDAEGNLPRDVMPDMLHPNAKGYQIWADAIKPQLTEWLGPPAATRPAAQ